MADIKRFDDEASWLEARRGSVQSSEAAALLGISPYTNALMLWARKTGAQPEPRGTLRQRVGKALEPFVIEEAARRLGEIILPVGRTIAYCPGNRNLGATLDGVAVQGAGLAPDPARDSQAAFALLVSAAPVPIRELKTVSTYAKGWDQQAGDEHAGRAPEPPLYVLVQAQHQYACYPAATGLKVIALFGLGENDDNGLAAYEIPRHDEIIAALKVAADEFMECVRTKTPPSTFPGGDQQLAAKTLAKLYPKSDPSMTVKLPSEFTLMLKNLHALKRAIKGCESDATEIENRFKVAMADAETAELEDGQRVTWKTQPRAGYTVQPGEARFFRIPKETP